MDVEAYDEDITEPIDVSPYALAVAELERYLHELDAVRATAEATPELSLREPLLRLMQAYARSAGRMNLVIAQEANAGEAGQPDVFVKDGPRLIGFLETKAPGADLRRLLRSDTQIRRYNESFANWVLTDYYRFLFLRDGVVDEDITAESSDELASAFQSFFAYAPPTIRARQRLAQELARRARVLRDGLAAAIRAEPDDGPLRNMLAFYRQTLMDDLDEVGFADTFAQTIVYGMFLGWLREPGPDFSRRSAANAIPASVPFLRSAVRMLTDDDLLPPTVTKLLDDLAALLANTRVERIRAEVAAGGLERDLVIYFYEKFLEQYDAGEKMRRGVFYTPPELVRYLVGETHQLLADDFALPNGLADASA